MKNFKFQAPTKIIFGKGAEDSVGKEAKKLGKTVLLHYGTGSIKKYGLYNKVIGSLKKEVFAQFASRVWNVNVYFDDLEKVALEGIKNFEDFLKEIGLPTRLKQIDIYADRLEEMAAKCTEGGPIGEFVKLEYRDVLNIYKLAL